MINPYRLLHRTSLFLFFMICTALMPQSASGQACDAAFLAVRTDIENADLGLDLETNVMNKVNDAASKYFRGTIKQRSYIDRDLVNAYSQIKPETAPGVGPELRGLVEQTIGNLRRCVANDHRGFGTITIRVRDVTGAAPVPFARIRINGYFQGLADGAGQLTFPIREGSVEISATSSPYFGRSVTTVVTAGETRNLDIVMDEARDVYENSQLVLAESVNGVLDAAVPAFTLRMMNGAQTLPITQISEATLFDPPDSAFDVEEAIYMDSLFTVSAGGVITPTNLTTLRNNLTGRSGTLRLVLDAEDASGAVYRSEVEFQMGRYQVNVTLKAPPSFPGMSVAGIAATVKSTPGKVLFRLFSNASGVITLPRMPEGVFEITAVTFQNGRFYYGEGVALTDSNYLIQVNMLNTVDRAAGVVPFTITPQLTGTPKRPVDMGLRLARLTAASRPLVPFTGVGQIFKNELRAPGGEASITATSGPQGVPVSDLATLTVPQGTQTVALRYNIQTLEYPTYVLSQSIFNDIWNLSVETPSGQRLFGLTRRVNEQVYTPPTWQADGTTGNKEQLLNVAALTVNGPTTLTVFGSATNVSDASLATTVQACLGCQTLSVNINRIVPDDDLQRSSGRRDRSGEKILVDSEYHSIPRQGETNTIDRYFKLLVNKSPNAIYQSIRAQVVDRDGFELMTLFDGPIQGNPNVQVIDQNTLRVKVSMRPMPSTIDTDPPPTETLSFRFRVAVSNGQGTVMDERDSSPRKPLWRMPAGIARYGFRDPGGDDWCSKGTFDWLLNNGSLVNFVDDISGEHARDLQHYDHNTGEDLDLYHPFVSPDLPMTTGLGYHRLLRARVVEALTSPPARQIITQWVLQSRARIDGLSQSGNVRRIFYSEGEASTNVPSGWARSLLRTGRATVSGQQLDLGLPGYTNPKLVNNHVHDSHMHVALFREP